MNGIQRTERALKNRCGKLAVGWAFLSSEECVSEDHM